MNRQRTWTNEVRNQIHKAGNENKCKPGTYLLHLYVINSKEINAHKQNDHEEDG